MSALRERRLRALGVTVSPWQAGGKHIVVCPQSAEYMALVGWQGDWTDGVTTTLPGQATFSDAGEVVRLSLV
ncbi:MAG: hypothetical protein V4567_00090, partial [Pseudomonadota bacterium]